MTNQPPGGPATKTSDIPESVEAAPVARDEQILATFEVFDAAWVTFAPPEGTEDIVDSYSYMDRALEYYLLARYAHLHRMHSAFMINSFWAVEYVLLATLRLRFKTKEDLAAVVELHALTKYWVLVKEMVSSQQLAAMEKFDSYVSRVQGHFKERYPTAAETKLTYEGKRPRVKLGDEGNQRRAKFDREAPLSLSDFDHFMNFMFHDIAPDKADVSQHLTQRLAMFESRDLYFEQNEFSVAYPNKRYHGELAADGNPGASSTRD